MVTKEWGIEAIHNQHPKYTGISLPSIPLKLVSSAVTLEAPWKKAGNLYLAYTVGAVGG